MTHQHSFSIFFAVLAFVLMATYLPAQKLVPIHQGSRLQNDHEYTNFPFYEDFSKVSTGLADTSRWVDGSGVYVNYTYGINPPTIGVATFDGLDATGTPYSFEAPSDLGQADILTSKLIDLSGYVLNDQLTFSFYWQARGWGEQPNADDSLILEFKNNEGAWIRQWGASADTITEFDQDTITITQNSFLHEEFQFRFLNYGRLSGAYDTWNLDYIYFNRLADADSPNTGIVRDLGFGQYPPSLLKGYSHVPWEAFQAWRNSVDTLYAPLSNVRSSGVGDNTTHLFGTKIYVDDALVSEEVIPASSVNRAGLASSNGTIFIFEGETVEVQAPVSLSLDNISSEAKVRIEQAFFLFENAEDLNAVSSKQNDTLSIVTSLDHTFAYDDGSAELGWGVNKKFGKFAMEFETPVDWRVDAIDLHIARVGRKLTQGGFRVGIWQYIDTLNAANDIILSPLKYYPISYTDSINEFERFPLANKVVIPAGKFYMVVEQLTDELLPIGFDVQTDRSDKLFVNLGGTKWNQNNQFAGTIMMRAVQETSLVTANDEEKIFEGLILYPNPSNGKVYWDMDLDRVEVADALGRTITVWDKQQRTVSQLDLTGYASGIYFIRLFKDGVATGRKLIKQ